MTNNSSELSRICYEITETSKDAKKVLLVLLKATYNTGSDSRKTIKISAYDVFKNAGVSANSQISIMSEINSISYLKKLCGNSFARKRAFSFFFKVDNIKGSSTIHFKSKVFVLGENSPSKIMDYLINENEKLPLCMKKCSDKNIETIITEPEQKEQVTLFSSTKDYTNIDPEKYCLMIEALKRVTISLGSGPDDYKLYNISDEDSVSYDDVEEQTLSNPDSEVFYSENVFDDAELGLNDEDKITINLQTSTQNSKECICKI